MTDRTDSAAPKGVSEAANADQPNPHQSDTVVVGIDGSDGAIHALRWAIDKAPILGQVTPVTSFQLPVTFDLLTRPPTGTDLAAHRTAAQARLTTSLHGEDPALLERARVIEAHPGEGLVKAAADADLLVVGTRGRSTLVASWLGSVSAYCVNHATGPVAVIPPDWPVDKPLATIVVGVDGSDHARAALGWAIDHVAPGGSILAVGCFSMWAYMEGVPDPPLEELEKGVRKKVEQAVAAVTGTSPGDPEADPKSEPKPQQESESRLDVDVEVRVESRDPRVALAELAAAEGDLLVVGAKGVSGLTHLLLGSVASALIHHPTVPTVVVPAPDVTEPKEAS